MQTKIKFTGPGTKCIICVFVLWYKYYSGGWCTWLTPLKYAESNQGSLLFPKNEFFIKADIGWRLEVGVFYKEVTLSFL